jgi:hypothetical protein
MRGLDKRLRRLERAASPDPSDLTDAELNRQIAVILASVRGEPVEAIETAIPAWSDDLWKP